MPCNTGLEEFGRNMGRIDARLSLMEEAERQLVRWNFIGYLALRYSYRTLGQRFGQTIASQMVRPTVAVRKP